jgi:hypothetical protein
VTPRPRRGLRRAAIAAAAAAAAALAACASGGPPGGAGSGAPAPPAGPSAPPAGSADAAQPQLFALIAAVPPYQEPPDPLPLIRAVNALQRLGRARAIATLQAYLQATPRDRPERTGTFLIMRALFEVPDPPGYLPPMLVGAPEPPAPADPRALPRFPIAIVDDIPLRVTAGYALAGKAEAPEAHLARLAQGGVLRARPLAPPDDPLAAIDRIAGSAGTPFLRDAGLDDDRGRARILDQGLRLVAEVAAGPAGTGGERFPAGPDTDARWQAARRAVLARPIVWDAAADRYRFRTPDDHRLRR